MSQTGVRSTGSRRQARMNSDCWRGSADWANGVEADDDMLLEYRPPAGLRSRLHGNYTMGKIPPYRSAARPCGREERATTRLS